ncbi:piggyBac transposable element-derived protein 4 [Trichonephila clavipes]|nr:piggyBac transposable element-derived protein 4 [Trichonephila clavipes]
MIEAPSYKDVVKRKPQVVMEHINTMGGVDRMDPHLIYYPITKKRQEILQKNILPPFSCIIVECFRFLYQRHGGKLSHLNFRLDIADHLIKIHGAVNDRKGRPGILPNSLQLTD